VNTVWTLQCLPLFLLRTKELWRVWFFLRHTNHLRYRLSIKMACSRANGERFVLLAELLGWKLYLTRRQLGNQFEWFGVIGAITEMTPDILSLSLSLGEIHGCFILCYANLFPRKQVLYFSSYINLRISSITNSMHEFDSLIKNHLNLEH